MPREIQFRGCNRNRHHRRKTWSATRFVPKLLVAPCEANRRCRRGARGELEARRYPSTYSAPNFASDLNHQLQLGPLFFFSK